MRKSSLILIFLLYQLLLNAQINNVNDSLTSIVSNRRLNGFLTLITDITMNDNRQFVMTGIGGAFSFNDKFYVGGYGMGLTTSIYQQWSFNGNKSAEYQLNFAHGGLWLGLIDEPCKRFQNKFSIKIGWGALFLQNINTVINYNSARDEFLIISPQIETGIALTDWLRINLGIGVRFLSGISTLYKDQNGIMTKIYKSSDFEGINGSLTLSFGSFCK